VMVKLSMPFREVTRGSDPMKAVQGISTHESQVLLQTWLVGAFQRPVM